MPNFKQCEYGPFALRRMLRQRLLTGEKIVGWTTAWLSPPAHLVILATGMMLVPIVGHALFASVLAARRRLVILTDSRLMLLATNRTACDVRGMGVKTDAPLHSIAISNTRRPTQFKVTLPDQRRPVTLALDSKTSSAQRVQEGLRLLAGETDDLGLQTSSSPPNI